jgi:phospholipase C
MQPPSRMSVAPEASVSPNPTFRRQPTPSWRLRFNFSNLYSRHPESMKQTCKSTIVAALFATSAALSSLNAAYGEQIRADDQTTTPIKHVIVIFQENVSFDHYFATYPYAQNTEGTVFKPSAGTPTVKGLGILVNGKPVGPLLTDNPNARNPLNGSSASNPFRLSHSQASTCDQDHNYGAEQLAFDHGLMDRFPLGTGSGDGGSCNSTYSYGHGSGVVMGYFDGNTVIALWNYAQHFAMNDNSFGTTFGPSTPGALNLIAGNTYPIATSASTPEVVENMGGTVVADLDPTGDVCSRGTTIRMGGRNVGDLLNAKHVSWGAFMGGFDLTIINPNGTAKCDRSSLASPAKSTKVPPPADNYMIDYIPHHAWFQYFASTANPSHQRPKVPPSQFGISADTVANHQYDLHDFFDALSTGFLPAVSFLKATASQDGHAGYSDPLMEQDFLVKTINAIEKSRLWENTAIIINWDDSDGWYDHQMSPIVNSSAVLNPVDQSQYGDNLNGTGKCGKSQLLRDDKGIPIQGRCGYGPRLPLLVISPYAKEDFVDHTLTDQSSILRFIEDNWHTGRVGNGSFDALAGPLNHMFDFSPRSSRSRRIFLKPDTGEIE